MITRILVAIDGGESSLAALNFAARIANQAAAQLIGLAIEDRRRFFRVNPIDHFAVATGLNPVAVETPLSPEEMLKETEKSEKESKQISLAFESACTEAGIEGQFISEGGLASESIASFAKSVDLIVVGSEGRHTGLINAEPGDTVRSILHSTVNPVLVVSSTIKPPKKALVAYNSSPAADRALRATLCLALTLGVQQIDLLTVNHEDEVSDIQEPAADYLTNSHIQVNCIARKGEVHDEIRHHALTNDIDIVSLGAYDKSTLSEKLFGSTTQELLNSPPTAILFVR